MNCKKCGHQIEENIDVCNYCGVSQKEQIPAIPSPAIGKPIAAKTYSSIFWKYFLALFLIGLISLAALMIFNDRNNIIYWGLTFAATYWFCRSIETAMRSIGKNNWWPIGLLGLLPFGFWVAYFVVRHQLKPLGKWGSDKLFLIFIIMIIFRQKESPFKDAFFFLNFD